MNRNIVFIIIIFIISLFIACHSSHSTSISTNIDIYGVPNAFVPQNFSEKSNEHIVETSDTLLYKNVSESLIEKDAVSQKSLKDDTQNSDEDSIYNFKSIYHHNFEMEGLYPKLEELYLSYTPDNKMADVEIPDSVVLYFNGLFAEIYIVAKKNENGSIKTFYNKRLVHHNKISSEENEYILKKCSEIAIGPQRKGIIKLRKKIREHGGIINEDLIFGNIKVFDKGKKIEPLKFNFTVEDSDGIVTLFTKEFLDLIAYTQLIILRENHNGVVSNRILGLYNWPEDR